MANLDTANPHPLREAMNYKSQRKVATHKYVEEQPTKLRSTVQFGPEKLGNKSTVRDGDHLYFGAIRKSRKTRPKQDVYHYSNKTGKTHMHQLGREASTKLKSKCKDLGGACTVK